MSRSTLQIIIANKEGEDVSRGELSLALEAMSGINHFYKASLDKLIEAIEQTDANRRLKLRCEMEKGMRETLFKAMKKPPAEWLGPDNLPGSPALLKRIVIGKKIFKAATGEDL